MQLIKLYFEYDTKINLTVFTIYVLNITVGIISNTINESFDLLLRQLPQININSNAKSKELSIRRELQ